MEHKKFPDWARDAMERQLEPLFSTKNNLYSGGHIHLRSIEPASNLERYRNSEKGYVQENI